MPLLSQISVICHTHDHIFALKGFTVCSVYNALFTYNIVLSKKKKNQHKNGTKNILTEGESCV